MFWQAGRTTRRSDRRTDGQKDGQKSTFPPCCFSSPLYFTSSLPPPPEQKRLQSPLNCTRLSQLLHSGRFYLLFTAHKSVLPPDPPHPQSRSASVTNAGERGGRTLLQQPINGCLGPSAGLRPIRRRISGDGEEPRYSVFMMAPPHPPSAEEPSLNWEGGGGRVGGGGGGAGDGGWGGKTGTNGAN